MDICKGKLVSEISLSKEFYYKSFTCLTSTHTGLYVFIGNACGHIYQYDIKEQKIIHEYFRVDSKKVDAITKMVITNDDRFLFVTNNQGTLYQYNINEKKLHKKWGNVNGTTGGNWSMALSSDNQWLFVSGKGPFLTKYSLSGLESQDLITIFSDENEGGFPFESFQDRYPWTIFSVDLCDSDRYLMVGGNKGRLIQ